MKPVSPALIITKYRQRKGREYSKGFGEPGLETKFSDYRSMCFSLFYFATQYYNLQVSDPEFSRAVEKREKSL